MTAPSATLGRLWEAEKACTGSDPTAFFTTATSPARRPDRVTRENLTATAWEFCSRCPALQLCADTADAGMDVGLWAGSLRRRRFVNTGDYIVDPLIPSAPASRHTPTEEAA